ncbi:hypothetical protein Tco_0250500, partial [Tanacetum coccineum]
RNSNYAADRSGIRAPRQKFEVLYTVICFDVVVFFLENKYLYGVKTNSHGKDRKTSDFGKEELKPNFQIKHTPYAILMHTACELSVNIYSPRLEDPHGVCPIHAHVVWTWNKLSTQTVPSTHFPFDVVIGDVLYTTEAKVLHADNVVGTDGKMSKLPLENHFGCMLTTKLRVRGIMIIGIYGCILTDLKE